MIRDQTTDVETLTTLGADRLKMEVDPDGLVHICDLLSNAYSDEELAVLREYATNARDSHIMAGQSRPIEITLPCESWEIPSPERGRFLRIKDYGLGLSVEEIAHVYSRYGKSTKDDSNEVNGMMGIGGKSGLCSTFGSFKITGVKDGEKAIVMCGRNEAAEPVMDLVSVTQTDEPNGVEIELAAPRYNGLKRKAANLFQFWPEGSVLVDGKAPERLKPKIEISPTMWIVEGLYSKNQRTDFLVMADVPYPVQFDGKLADGYSLVVFVPTGSVSIHLSREALRYTDKTKDCIARITAEYDQSVKSTIQRHVDAAKTKAEAVRVALKWHAAFASKEDLDVKYKGQKMPMRFDVAGPLGAKAGIIVTEHESDKLSAHSKQQQIFIGTLLDAVLVHGYNVGGTFTPTHKKKLEAWAKSKGIEPKHYVLTEGRLAHGWIDSTRRVDWETVKAIKVHTVKGRDGRERPKGSYDIWVDWVSKPGTPADQIDLSKPIFWCDHKYLSNVSSGYYGRQKRAGRQAMMRERYPNCTIVELTGNRINKFKRDFPEAREIRVILEEIYEDLKKSVTNAHKKRAALRNSGAEGTLLSLDIDRVDDPAVKSAIRLAKKPFDTDEEDRIDHIRRMTGHQYHDEKFFTVKWKNPLEAYPLANARHPEHTYIYMNAVYAAQEKK